MVGFATGTEANPVQRLVARAILSPGRLAAGEVDPCHRRMGHGAVTMAFVGLNVRDVTDIDLVLFLLVRNHAGARGGDQNLVAVMRMRSCRASLAASSRRCGDPQANQRVGLHREPGSRPDVHHGHSAAARQRGAEAALSAEDRVRRIAAAGVRGDRADDRLGHDKAQDPSGQRGQPLCDQRAEGLDLARATRT
jgi:hypothetical protein